MKNVKSSIFNLLFYGKMGPNKIVIEKISGLLKRNPASEKLIENEWRKRIALGLKPWADDTKPSQYHFGGLRQTESRLKILADPTISYKDVIGSRLKKFKNSFAQEYWPVAVTVSLALMAKNKKGKKMLGLTLRNANHDHDAGKFHVTTAGAMEIKKDKKPIDAALRETEEEIGLKPNELSNILCRAIVYNYRLSEIGIIFVATAKITAEEISCRKHDDENDILFTPITKERLEYLLLKLTRANSIDGLVGILSIGGDLYGEKWAENILAKIIKKIFSCNNFQKKKNLEKGI